ncbi:hypothetical protein HIM_06324 [Hirsutella minnesotensis 3608]|uniref:Uncharacterized protein n=1 Tax=Hirsutella minnesotensis 3608 TaxID=1043627 RepID=A0A0F7ZU64_9HYPO|nr:hypothetical protein HIM_06324 [Hirsutella minnesotensis 3608]
MPKAPESELSEGVRWAIRRHLTCPASDAAVAIRKFEQVSKLRVKLKVDWQRLIKEAEKIYEDGMDTTLSIIDTISACCSGLTDLVKTAEERHLKVVNWILKLRERATDGYVTLQLKGMLFGGSLEPALTFERRRIVCGFPTDSRVLDVRFEAGDFAVGAEYAICDCPLDAFGLTMDIDPKQSDDDDVSSDDEPEPQEPGRKADRTTTKTKKASDTSSNDQATGDTMPTVNDVLSATVPRPPYHLLIGTESNWRIFVRGNHVPSVEFVRKTLQALAQDFIETDGEDLAAKSSPWKIEPFAYILASRDAGFKLMPKHHRQESALQALSTIFNLVEAHLGYHRVMSSEEFWEYRKDKAFQQQP